MFHWVCSEILWAQYLSLTSGPGLSLSFALANGTDVISGPSVSYASISHQAMPLFSTELCPRWPVSGALACRCAMPSPAAEPCPGPQVTKVRVTKLVSNTYHARVHYAPGPGFAAAAGVLPEELDVDARPSDAINLAVRFDAPIYISKEVCSQHE